eukprot:11842228-Alexandrium_andersonii.AAC.1
MAQNASLGSVGGPISRPFLGLHSSSSERLGRCCVFRRADCGLRQITALTSIGWIADCTLASLP